MYHLLYKTMYNDNIYFSSHKKIYKTTNISVNMKVYFSLYEKMYNNNICCYYIKVYNNNKYFLIHESVFLII